MLIQRLPEVKWVLGRRADASVYNAIRAGLFTTGVAIGQRAKGWPDYEVQVIVAARIAGKSDAEIREVVTVLHAKRTALPILHDEAALCALALRLWCATPSRWFRRVSK